MIDGFWIATLVLLAMTFGVIYFRYATDNVVSNWPLVYYGFAVVHLQFYPEGMTQNLVFTSIVAAMFIRFEFMAGFFLKAVQIVEYACLLWMAYQMFRILF